MTLVAAAGPDRKLCCRQEVERRLFVARRVLRRSLSSGALRHRACNVSMGRLR